MTLTARPHSFACMAPTGEEGHALLNGDHSAGGELGWQRKSTTPLTGKDTPEPWAGRGKSPQATISSLPAWIPLAPQNQPPSLRTPLSARTPASSRTLATVGVGSLTSREGGAPATPSTPGSRGSRLSSRPFQRRRTLDSFPMDRSQRDLALRAQAQVQQQRQAVAQFRKTLAWSESLRLYSRSRFDHAVKSHGDSVGERSPSPCPTSSGFDSRVLASSLATAGTAGDSGVSVTTPGPKEVFLRQPLYTVYQGERRLLQQPATPAAVHPPPTNGPTQVGSILYNRKPMLLNAIRTRPKSEPSGLYRHVQECPPLIRRCLAASNQQYRVVGGEAALPGCRSLLVPVLPPSQEEAPQEAGVGEGEDEGTEEKREGSETCLHLQLGEEEEGEAVLVPTFGMTVDTPRDAATSPTPPEMGQGTPDRADSSADNASSGKTGSLASRPSSVSSLGSARSNRSSRKRPVKAKRCHWVDLVSVSSENASPETQEVNADGTPAVPPKEDGAAPADAASPGVDPSQRVSPHPPRKDDLGPKAPSEDAESELLLPSFLCPSSEAKSREAATLRWLRGTAFKQGVRTMPLV